MEESSIHSFFFFFECLFDQTLFFLSLGNEHNPFGTTWSLVNFIIQNCLSPRVGSHIFTDL